MSQVTLYREIDALGGSGEGDWHKGYSEALEDVLALLAKRGFTDLEDRNDALRDHFAGQALVAVLRDHTLTEGYCDLGPRVFAECAYDIADAMLAERRKAGAA